MAQYLVFYVHADGTTEASWGESASYVTITGGTTGVDDNFSYDRNAYIGEAKRALLKTDNAARIQHDQKLLDALSEYFTNLDLNSDEALKIFGSGRLAKLKNGGQECLFEYQVNQNGVIRLSNFDTGYQPYFSTALNYKPTYISTTFSKNLDEKNIRTDTNLVTGSNGYNYVNQYLFTSNAFVGGEGSAGKVQVRIQYKNGKAVITTK